MTIVGPGGIGKTRLAIQLSSDVIDPKASQQLLFKDEVYFVSLQPLISSVFNLSVIAESLRFQFSIWKVTVSPFALWSAHAGWIVTSALVGLIVTIQVLGSLVVQGEYPDPFARYDAISPGNSTQALSEYPCAISQSRINRQLVPSHFSCTIFPQDGYFDIIHVEERDNEITELTFYATKVTLGNSRSSGNPLSVHGRPKKPSSGITGSIY